MKDVINRGTAASAGAWGFKNIAGKQAYAGKTGTSRDGWFAGFTPELVCVVYVGFDDGDDLGMKGADSALPIWADFMRSALDLHPEWNGDWAMPAGVRRGEIDIRNGSLIRELDAEEAVASGVGQPTPSPTRLTDSAGNPIDDGYIPEPPKEIYVTNVPAEFRRFELFIAGTLPAKQMISDGDPTINFDDGKPTPTPTPVNGTWQDGARQINSLALRVPSASAARVKLPVWVTLTKARSAARSIVAPRGNRTSHWKGFLFGLGASRLGSPG